MNDPQTLEIYSRVLLFKDDSFRDELAFARSLSASQRRTVHLVAMKLGLQHRSVGDGGERHAVVSKNGVSPASDSSSSGSKVGTIRLTVRIILLTHSRSHHFDMRPQRLVAKHHATSSLLNTTTSPRMDFGTRSLYQTFADHPTGTTTITLEDRTQDVQTRT